ncbi:hypothetical protein MNBD_GAMMA20-394 [hydrothermal vent metagenome]|uniref:Uncharacterized protein n=1 Tax=hydrothermal vent metagenome TaxID=652676 RepID=A0A3B1AQ81_9ZZZZ
MEEANICQIAKKHALGCEVGLESKGDLAEV